MPNPQTENGYTQIANEIVEALSRAMPGYTEAQIIWFILRKTYGWHKTEDNISISQIVSGINKSKRMVIYALLNLEAKKMIIIKRNIVKGEKQPNTISFNKDYSKWVVQEKTQQYKNSLEKRRKLYKQVVQEKTGSARKIEVEAKDKTGVVQEVVKSLPVLAHTKETITKDNILLIDKKNKITEEKPNTKKPTKKELEKTEALKTTEELIGFYNSTYGTNYTAPPLLNNVQYWLGMYSCAQIKEAICKIKYDDYWKDIMTPIIFFRRRNQRGEEVDNIGKFLNTAKPPEISTMPPAPKGFYK